MSQSLRPILLFAAMAAALLAVGFGQGWPVMLVILNLCLISAVMSVGLNMQWGYAGLFNAGVMAFVAVGGMVAVLISEPPVMVGWEAGGARILVAGVMVATFSGLIYALRRFISRRWIKNWGTAALLVAAYFIIRPVFEGGVTAVESIAAASAGNLGGLGLNILVSWVVAAVVCMGVAWVIGRIALGLRADYLAIATLGISEIVVAVAKNEEWLTRGVKNITSLKRAPVPRETNLQQAEWFQNLVSTLSGTNPGDAGFKTTVIEASSIFVKLCFTGLFTIVLGIVLFLAIRALNSPWGRMMRAIRDNDVAASAMGKNVVRRHREVFIVGAAILGVSGAMLTTLDGQFTPTGYQPLRYTFLIWVMVIVGGSGNNLGAVLGGFVIWFFWIEAEVAAQWISVNMEKVLTPYLDVVLISLGEGSLKVQHGVTWLKNAAPHFRYLLMGMVLLLALRFSPRGLIPEAGAARAH